MGNQKTSQGFSRKVILSFDDFASFPRQGNSNNFYFDSATGNMYYWDGTKYVALAKKATIVDNANDTFTFDNGFDTPTIVSIRDLNLQKNIIASQNLSNAEDYHILKIKSNCTLTIPTGLRKNWNVIIDCWDGATCTVAAGVGVTLQANDAVLVISPNTSRALYQDESTNVYRLLNQ